MKISAIICEYNPFHTGHLYHISETRKTCDHVVAIMSGSFVERGLPAVYDKWARTDAALLGGADLVLELPTAYAVASAERFAFGAVRTAELTGIVDTLSFGCETASLAHLQALADLFLREPADYRAMLKKELDNGSSYAAARAFAAEQYLPGAAQTLSQSNAILGIEYIKALRKINSDILPCPILRVGASTEQSDALDVAYPSARALRHAMQANGALPADALPSFSTERFSSEKPVFIEDFSAMLLYRLRMMQPAEIAKIAEIGEGLEHKIYAAARNAADFQTLLREIKSKRYPQSRLQRILINCLLGVTKALQAEADHAPYLRILGVRKESKFLLSLLSENAKAPVIISPADVQNTGLSLDIRATDIRALCDKGKAAGRDFTEKLHIL